MRKKETKAFVVSLEKQVTNIWQEQRRRGRGSAQKRQRARLRRIRLWRDWVRLCGWPSRRIMQLMARLRQLRRRRQQELKRRWSGSGLHTGVPQASALAAIRPTWHLRGGRRWR